MDRPTCKCGQWAWTWSCRYWIEEGNVATATSIGFCLTCNCRLEQDGTVTPMVEAADWEKLDQRTERLASQVAILERLVRPRVELLPEPEPKTATCWSCNNPGHEEFMAKHSPPREKPDGWRLGSRALRAVRDYAAWLDRQEAETK